jgi:hypothetical protein
MQIDVRDQRLGLRVGDTTHLNILTCHGCDSQTRGLTHYRPSRSGKSLRIISQPRAEFVDPTPRRAVRPATVEFLAAGELSFDGPFHVFGADPVWMGDAVESNCTSCGRSMPFLIQIDSDRDAGLRFADFGSLYAFACAACVEIATVVQTA